MYLFRRILGHFYRGSSKISAYENEVYQSKSEKYMNKHLRKPTISRSRLHNIFLNEKTENSYILQYANT